MLYALQVKIKEKYEHQYVAAKALGIAESRLSRILRGREPLSKPLHRKLEKLLRCRIQEGVPVGNAAETG